MFGHTKVPPVEIAQQHIADIESVAHRLDGDLPPDELVPVRLEKRTENGVHVYNLDFVSHDDGPSHPRLRVRGPATSNGTESFSLLEGMVEHTPVPHERRRGSKWAARRMAKHLRQMRLLVHGQNAQVTLRIGSKESETSGD